MKSIDLQMHTTASDGKFSPKEVVDLALKKDMKVIAITDHDNVDGLDEAINHAKDKEIEIVTGVEISCKEPDLKSTIDILGLFIDHKNPDFERFLENLRESRVVEKKQIVKNLNDLGYEITFEELLKEAKGSLGRPSVARILVRKYPDKFSTVRDVFDELIGEGKPAFVHRKKTSVKEALEIIKKAGGVPILAHPGRYFKETSEIIEKFTYLGGIGIEVDYPYDKVLRMDKEKSLELNQNFEKIAKEKNLLRSGGSDFHDFERGNEIGDAGVSEEELNLIRQAAKVTE